MLSLPQVFVEATIKNTEKTSALEENSFKDKSFGIVVALLILYKSQGRDQSATVIIGTRESR